MPILGYLEGLSGFAQVADGLVDVCGVVAEKTLHQVVQRALQLGVLGHQQEQYHPSIRLYLFTDMKSLYGIRNDFLDHDPGFQIVPDPSENPACKLMQSKFFIDFQRSVHD